MRKLINLVILAIFAFVVVGCGQGNRPDRHLVRITTDHDWINLQYSNGYQIGVYKEIFLDNIQQIANGEQGKFIFPADRGVWLDEDELAWSGRMLVVFDEAFCPDGALVQNLEEDSSGNLIHDPDCLSPGDFERMPWIEWLAFTGG